MYHDDRTVTQMATDLKVSRATIYRHIAALESRSLVSQP
jgi:predicted ArsR family transcriptional regulator